MANQRVEQRVYNALGQLTVQKGVIWPFITEAYEYWYTYADGANNGQITQFRDNKTGEEVNYTYDALNRLTKAETTGPEWGETMTYDGFGNLVSEAPTKGTAPYYNLTVDVNTNRILTAGFSYDAAGNMTANPLQTRLMYNPESKLTQIGYTDYRYGADGRLLMKGQMTSSYPSWPWYVSGSGYIYFRDPWGRERRIIQCTQNPDGTTLWAVVKQTDWFLGRAVDRGNGRYYAPDRVGSVRAVIGGYPGVLERRISYYPYGQERAPQSPNGAWKFGTYFREGTLDYADQRWYAGNWGRFTTADPYGASGRPEDPGSWNRYGYVEGDPVNFNDPGGLFRGRPDNPWSFVAGGWAPRAHLIGMDSREDQILAAQGGGRNTLSTAQNALNKVSGALSKAAGLQDVFTAEQLDCVSGIETGRTWNPDVVATNGRIGLFQFNKANWEASGTAIPWNNGPSAKDPELAAEVALALLFRKLGYNRVQSPSDDAVQGAIDKFGENDGRYGKTVMECAKQLKAGDFAGAYSTLQTYADWVAGGRK